MKKSLVVIMILSLITLSLNGCRKKTADEKEKTFEGVELTYYKVFDEPDVLEPLISEYQSAHPGLKIKYKYFDDFDEYQKVILNEMAEGEGPDIFSMQNTWFMSNFKKIKPLPQEFGTPEDFLATFVDVAYKDLVRPDSNNVYQVYGVPLTVDTLGLYYNRAHFEDRLPTKGKPSTTWEGIKEDVTFLNKEDNSLGRFEVSGIAMGRADNISRAVDVLYMLLLQFGAKFYNEDFSEAIFASQQGTVTEYPGMEALKLFTSFADDREKNYSWNEFIVDDDSLEKEVEAFARGEVSMIFGFAYTYDDIVKQIQDLREKGVEVMDETDIKVAPAPQIYDPEVSKDKRVTYAAYFAETVSRNSKHPDVAWDFLIWLAGKKNLDHYFGEVHKPTSRRDMIDDQKKDPIYGIFASQIGYAESFPILDYYVYKRIFTEVISNANNNGILQGDLLNAQNNVSAMLPVDGLIPKKQTEAEAKKAEKTESN